MKSSELEKRLSDLLSETTNEVSIDSDLNFEEETEIKPSVPVVYEDIPTSVTIDPDSDSYKDYVYTRSILYGLTSRGITALEDALIMAKESQHPRAYEVIATMMKNIADLSKDIMSLNQTQKTKDNNTKVVNNTQINNYSDSKISNTSESDIDTIFNQLD